MFYAVFQVFPIFVWLVLFLALIRPLRLPPAGQILCGILSLSASQKFIVYHLFGGDVFNPDLPFGVVLISSWFYSTTILLFFATVMVFFTRLVRRKIRASRRLPPEVETVNVLHRRRLYATFFLFIALALAGYGLWEGVRIPRIRQLELAFEDLPSEFDGYRIVQLSDLHCSAAARGSRFQKIVERVNALRPDLICITGDFVDGSPAKRAVDLAPLRWLHAPDGVFGCVGNHEYYSGYGDWRPLFAAWGIRMLENAHANIIRGRGTITVGGINDPGGDAAVVFAGTVPDAFRILLSHRPVWTTVNARRGVRLQLSGHTHGGGIRGLHYLVARLGNEGHVNGLYQDGTLTLYVSPGTGQWAGFPLRLGENSEITCLILRRKPQSTSVAN